MTNSKHLSGYSLTDRAQDSREALLTRDELNTIWNAASSALHNGGFGEAYRNAEALLCQADRGNVCDLALALPVKCEGMRGFTVEQLQGLTDRVESLNYHVDRSRE